MSIVLTVGVIGAFCIVAAAAYFFTVTRLSLVIQEALHKQDPSNHIYWIYKNKFLIWITDRQPILSALLLWNYHRLVNDVVNRLILIGEEKNVLQLSCAFGNISEKLAEKCVEHDAQFVVADIIPNELSHTQKKLTDRGLMKNTSFMLCDATSLPYPDESFDRVVSFFLFHELPLEKKREALKESMRVVKPGGKIIGAEFHRPDSWLLRVSGILFFAVFERYAREMWHTFNLEAEILAHARDPKEWTFSKKPIFKENYFSFEAQKMPR
ncbi:hypothetical protein A2Z10_01785 [Candidatus Azambacteria bacterium RBG_16_47_10]|uniref:Methyltransferase domain-containing protein n=1 Tax=Candidatus Azambacteria bacterium RBG_16_47_10 TaxID=1797292 RepID=A0A1F5B1E9_9BACT|nr:MAG: hypothetical protein A2Z10_01785 [Candidatus Azambacteria bacterium RBG_16_47_10]